MLLHIIFVLFPWLRRKYFDELKYKETMSWWDNDMENHARLRLERIKFGEKYKL